MEEFRFYTSLELVELTGKKARNMQELADVIRDIDESSIFYHTHRFFREHHFVRGEYSSDFAQWVFGSLQDMTLAEKLAEIDILTYSKINAIREVTVDAIDDHIRSGVRVRNVPSGMEFHFCKSISTILPTTYVARDIDSLLQAMRKISKNSLYFHLFESRIRGMGETRDLCRWIKESLNAPALSDEIRRIDPYAYTLDEVRAQLIEIMGRGLVR